MPPPNCTSCSSDALFYVYAGSFQSSGCIMSQPRCYQNPPLPDLFVIRTYAKFTVTYLTSKRQNRMLSIRNHSLCYLMCCECRLEMSLQLLMQMIHGSSFIRKLSNCSYFSFGFFASSYSQFRMHPTLILQCSKSPFIIILHLQI